MRMAIKRLFMFRQVQYERRYASLLVEEHTPPSPPFSNPFALLCPELVESSLSKGKD
jgi:hypothetical protein